jgi:type IV pilus assembly protein PilY1
MTAQPTLAALLNLAQTPLFIGAAVPPQVMLTISKDPAALQEGVQRLHGSGRRRADRDDLQALDRLLRLLRSDQVLQLQHHQPALRAGVGQHRQVLLRQLGRQLLNWAAMSRMDAVRKLLYGGMRSTDTSSTTVLERVLPADRRPFLGQVLQREPISRGSRRSIRRRRPRRPLRPR